jgi:hypothetical protein
MMYEKLVALVSNHPLTRSHACPTGSWICLQSACRQYYLFREMKKRGPSSMMRVYREVTSRDVDIGRQGFTVIFSLYAINQTAPKTLIRAAFPEAKGPSK